MLAHLLLRLEALKLSLGGVDAVFGTLQNLDVPAGRRSSRPAFLRATTHLDREELRHEGGDRDRLGVKSGGERMAVEPGGAVLIPPEVRHRAMGRMAILNIVVPPFDPADEWFD
jgi:hypothetical protein